MSLPSLDAPVRLVPLGGLGEIGLNCLVVEAGDERLVIDCGLLFPGAEAALGVEVIAPDFSHLRAQGPPTAVLLTHAHEDHIGALPYLLREWPDTPLLGTRFTLAVVKAKLHEHGITPRLQEMKARGRASLGKAFEVEPIQVPHSVPDSVGFAVRTPAGVIIHTGDFKVDWSPTDGRLLDVRRLSELGDEGVACLLSDSTNAEREGTSASESEVGESLARIFAGPDVRGRIFVALFGSNLHRVGSVLRAAASLGRKVCLLGRSLEQNVRLALDMGVLQADPGIFIDAETADHFAPRELIFLTTGAQGEPRSALPRLARGDHPAARVEPGDLVVLSSRVIPGNDRLVATLVDLLVRRGARVLSSLGGTKELIHTTGHAHRGDQRMVLDLVRPRAFVPIHGEYRMLAAHAGLARESGVPADACLVAEDGDVVELRERDAASLRVQAAPVGRMYLDARGAQSDVSAASLRDRQQLAETGVLLVLCVLDRASGAILRGPEVLGKGIVGLDARRTEQARQGALDALAQVPAHQRRDLPALEEALRLGARSAWKKNVEKRPLVMPIVLEL